MTDFITRPIAWLVAPSYGLRFRRPSLTLLHKSSSTRGTMNTTEIRDAIYQHADSLTPAEREAFARTVIFIGAGLLGECAGSDALTEALDVMAQTTTSAVAEGRT